MVEIDLDRPSSIFENANEFSTYIEEQAIKHNQNLIDTLIAFCETYGVEPEDFKKSISESLKGKLEVEFKELNMLPKSASLEFLWDN
jgi:replication initiation and membrane attachment protein DnaB